MIKRDRFEMLHFVLEMDDIQNHRRC
jgi:hypothetical protein